ncbi:MAG: YitT family protein [Clostridia bacterium]|nr:YitT family protein [Clostridia bacterium]
MKHAFSFLKKIRLKNVAMLTLAGIVNACGITIFLNPVDLYDSGISGTSMLLDQVVEPVSLSLFLLMLNIPLFLYGLKKQGALFTLYAIYTVGIYSLAAWLITGPLPIDVSFASPLANKDLLLCALFGGLISGVGSGLAIRGGGAMDGIEIMAVIFSKRLGVSVGTFVMVYNLGLYIVCGCIMADWILPLYSIVAYAVGVKTIDFVVEGFDRSKCAIIITVKATEVCDALSDAFQSGPTCIEARGGYTNAPKTMVYFIVNRFQVTKMKEIVHDIDPTAYITISEVADVYSANQGK